MRTDNQPGRTALAQRGLTLADRFDGHRDMILRFLHDLSVPPTNYAELRVMPMSA
jgi:hypothetical protein